MQSSPTARPKRLLLVEPDRTVRAALAATIEWIAAVDRHARFETARAQLASSTYDLLVTRVRLAEFNGLHLVYLANVLTTSTRAIVYDEHPNPSFAAEARRAGAFFDIAERLRVTLTAYVNADLPESDRRASVTADRRSSPRGGRRAWDRYVLASAGAV